MAHDESAEHDGNPLELGVAHFPTNIRWNIQQTSLLKHSITSTLNAIMTSKTIAIHYMGILSQWGYYDNCCLCSLFADWPWSIDESWSIWVYLKMVYPPDYGYSIVKNYHRSLDLGQSYFQVCSKSPDWILSLTWKSLRNHTAGYGDASPHTLCELNIAMGNHHFHIPSGYLT